jgi:hypothetical protein
MIFILNNFLISFKYAIYFGYLTVSMIPLLYCFNALENLRLEQANGGPLDNENDLYTQQQMDVELTNDEEVTELVTK